MQNPIRTIKAHHTLKEISQELGIAESMIQRALEGAYPQLPDSILEGFEHLANMNYNRGVRYYDSAALDSYPAKPISKEQIASQYKAYQDTELSKVKLPPMNLYRGSSLEEWFQFAYHLAQLNDVNLTPVGMGKLLKINPAVITKWEAGKMQRIPVGIIDRLKEIKELQGGR